MVRREEKKQLIMINEKAPIHLDAPSCHGLEKTLKHTIYSENEVVCFFVHKFIPFHYQSRKGTISLQDMMTLYIMRRI